jgi:hypothetical protein
VTSRPSNYGPRFRGATVYGLREPSIAELIGEALKQEHARRIAKRRSRRKVTLPEVKFLNNKDPQP